MSSFFSEDSYGTSEVTKMSIGECFNLLTSKELKRPDYQREYVWSKKQQAFLSNHKIPLDRMIATNCSNDTPFSNTFN